MRSISVWGRRALACGLCWWLIGSASQASAATRTWTGNGADSLVSTAQNWAGNQVPQDGDDLVFPLSAINRVVTQNLNIQFHSMTFASDTVQPYHVAGDVNIIDRIQVDAGNVSFGSGTLTLAQNGMTPADITFAAATSVELTIDDTIAGSSFATLHVAGQGRVTFGTANGYGGSTMVDSGTLRVQDDLSLGATPAATAYVAAGATLQIEDSNGGINHSLQINDGGILQSTTGTTLYNIITLVGNTVINVAAGKNLILASLVKGPGTFTKSGSGFLTLGSTVDNTFGGGAGAPTVSAGSLFLDQHFGAATHVALPYGVTVNSGADVIYTSSNQIGGAVVINGGGTMLLKDQTDAIGSLDGPAGGTVDMNGGVLTLSAGVFGGAITGTGALNVSGGSSAIFELTGTSTFTGTTTVSNGTQLRVTGSLPGPIVLTNASLTGTGTVGTVTGVFGRVVPGKQGGGTLHTQSLSLTGGDLHLQAFQTLGGPAFASVAVTGTVTLGNALALTPDFDPAIIAVPATPIVIIENDGTDPIVGTFSGLPEGASFVTNGITYHISYHGGDGNDVVLVATSSGTPQPRTYYLSEGSTGGFFTTDVLIANPNGSDAPVTLTFYTQANGVVTKDITVPALQRVTVTLNTLPELGDGAVSTVVTSTSGAALVVERTMSWDKTGYGASGDKAVDAPSTTWYFAEGSQGFFSTYVLLANPQTTANTATVTYLREFEGPITRSYPLDPQSRTTLDLGADTELVNRSFGMQVQFAQPGVAERSMYFGKNPFWKGGHESAGVTTPAADWLLAEGATGPFFETFILLANPNATDADATVTFLPAGGSPVVKTKTIPANGRLTINIEAEDPALANAAVATQVHANLPVVAERSQYWPDPAPQWYEAHNGFGLTAPGTKWGLAEGRVGQTPSYQSYILLANPGQMPATVSIQFLREHGGAPFTKTFSVPATGRLNVAITGAGSDVPELADENFGAIITSDQPIGVERSMYSNANGLTWSAGTNAAGSPLP